jgi:hypothetical protein
MSSPPKAFISYAGEDAAFAEDLAERLRRSGVDTYFAGWALKPGDDLVRRVFDALNASAWVLVVVSLHSQSKPFPLAEVSTAVHKELTDRSLRIIPVLIDDATQPPELSRLVHVRIDPSKDYTPALNRILDSIFGVDHTPPVGAAPAAFSRAISRPFGYLSSFDQNLLEALARIYCDSGENHIDGDRLAALGNSLKVDDGLFEDSLRLLEGEGLVKLSIAIGHKRAVAARLTEAGREFSLKHCLDGYKVMLKSIASRLANDGGGSSEAVAQKTGVPRYVVEHVFRLLNSKDHVKISETRPWISAWQVSPRLRRAIELGEFE